MPLISVELPSGEMLKLAITDITTLKEIADQLHIPNAIFFGYRLNGELGTLMGYASDSLFSMFNTDSCVILDSTNIPDRDQESVTKWLAVVFGLPPS